MAEMTEEERDLLLAQQKMEQVGAMLRTLASPVTPSTCVSRMTANCRAPG
jgi:hypothetical protein